MKVNNIIANNQSSMKKKYSLGITCLSHWTKPESSKKALGRPKVRRNRLQDSEKELPRGTAAQGSRDKWGVGTE